MHKKLKPLSLMCLLISKVIACLVHSTEPDKEWHIINAIHYYVHILHWFLLPPAISGEAVCYTDSA